MNDITKESPAVGPVGPRRKGSDGREGRDGSERHREREGADQRHSPLACLFDRFASFATRWAGSPSAFCGAVFVIVAWLVAGPFFHYSDAWQLFVNTGTTIITFLMVFLLQQSQNKDSVAMHLKLDELLSSQRAASNALIGIEHASEEELRRLAATYLALASQRRQDGDADEDDEREEDGAREAGQARGAGEAREATAAAAGADPDELDGGTGA